jgi:sirohydrochlorin cobaltochelatase
VFSVAEVWGEVKVAGKMMAMTPEDRRAFESFELRIQTILPEEYQDCYDEVAPVSMGSAGLKYGRDGKVAWQDIWQTFCDLAMAGGPPHKGKLLLPATRAEIEAAPGRYAEVVAEICRGVKLVTFLECAASEVPGWVRVECGSAVTAGWLARAIVMENVSARCELAGDATGLLVPAGPGFRVEKEIKNVVTVMAKTCHYWLDHTWDAQKKVIGDLFLGLGAETALAQPAVAGLDFELGADRRLREQTAGRIREELGLEVSSDYCPGWLGVVFPSVKAAIWVMRGMVVSNVMARREDVTLFLPVGSGGDSVVGVLGRVLEFSRVRGVV